METILFDSACPACSRAAKRIRALGLSIETASVRDATVQERLTQLGLRFDNDRPALLVEDGESTALLTGWRMRARLARAVGPRHARELIELARIEGDANRERRELGISRRGIVTGAITAGAAVALSAAPAAAIQQPAAKSLANQARAISARADPAMNQVRSAQGQVLPKFDWSGASVQVTDDRFAAVGTTYQEPGVDIIAISFVDLKSGTEIARRIAAVADGLDSSFVVSVIDDGVEVLHLEVDSADELPAGQASGLVPVVARAAPCEIAWSIMCGAGTSLGCALACGAIGGPIAALGCGIVCGAIFGGAGCTITSADFCRDYW